MRGIEKSLQDIEDGVYGLCEQCEEEIAFKMMIAAQSSAITWAKPVPLICTGWSRSAGKSFWYAC